MYENQFAKEWKELKNAWEKLGVQKPAETKKFILGIEKRVSSGIGSALKDLDKADPGVSENELRKLDPKDLKKRMLAYTAALDKYSKAAAAEVKSIDSEIEKFQRAMGTGADSKTDFYRGMKTFKAKLKEYEAHATKRQDDMAQIVLDPKASEFDQRSRKFAPRVKVDLRKGVSAIQEVKASPDKETYNKAVGPVIKDLYLIFSEAKILAGWDGKTFSGWESVEHKVRNAYLTDVSDASEIPVKLKTFSGILKDCMDLVGLVK